jgi:hypothetical protein
MCLHYKIKLVLFRKIINLSSYETLPRMSYHFNYSCHLVPSSLLIYMHLCKKYVPVSKRTHFLCTIP